MYTVLLGPSNASVGQYFYVVDASVDPAITDAHTEVVSDRVPDNQEGVGGDCYLIVTGGVPGSTRVKVVYCWRSQPDSAGTCDQSEGTTPGQLMEHEFTVEVK